MTIETLKDRIAKAEAKIEKKQGTIARYQKIIANKKAKIEKMGFTLEELAGTWSSDQKKYEAQWLLSDIETAEEGISNAEKEISKMTETLNELKEELQKAEEKANSRNVEAILTFLRMWKERVTEYYKDSFEEYLIAREDYNKEYDRLNKIRWNAETVEERRAAREQQERNNRKFHKAWNFVEVYEYCGRLDEARLEKDLQRDADRKYDDIIEKTNKIVGEIKDATNLRVGEKGELNGYVFGTNGKAHVETIGAGGYNIQCFHFRTLIHEVK